MKLLTTLPIAAIVLFATESQAQRIGQSGLTILPSGSSEGLASNQAKAVGSRSAPMAKTGKMILEQIVKDPAPASSGQVQSIFSIKKGSDDGKNDLIFIGKSEYASDNAGGTPTINSVKKVCGQLPTDFKRTRSGWFDKMSTDDNCSVTGINTMTQKDDTFTQRVTIGLELEPTSKTLKLGSRMGIQNGFLVYSTPMFYQYPLDYFLSQEIQLNLDGATALFYSSTVATTTLTVFALQSF